ncbi:MAG: protein-L-isoaspartate(D-aspartate) O-methyltransferase [Pirellulaceae bacterium]
MTITGLTAAKALAQSRSQFEQLRQKMVQEAVVGAGVTDERVVKAMLATPRHEFVAAGVRGKAYFDMALPIGDSQTISSPFIVAFMTESIDPQPTDKVLEIGTGSGYQAAVLSPLVRQVYTIEIVEPLGERAARTLKRLGYDNVKAKVGDGYLGWPEHAPFDKIIVTCSPERVPKPLVEQLKEGGLMIIPVGERYQQTLYLLRKKDGELEFEKLRPTLFVPMTGHAESGREKQPDPANPKLVNGDFEQEPEEEGFVPGWYYNRQVERIEDRLAPDGQHYVTFRNDEPGRPSHLLQGLPVDGRVVSQFDVRARVKYQNIRAGTRRDELPVIAVSFYDESRRDLGSSFIGPFTGDQPWHQVSKSLRVPEKAREAIFRIGLFGGTGEISFDSITLTPVK